MTVFGLTLPAVIGDLTLAEELLAFVQDNPQLIAAAVLALLVFYVLRKVLKSDSPKGGAGKQPRNEKQARKWAQAELDKQNFREAGDYFEFAGDFDAASNAYGRAGAYEQAAEAALRGGLKDRAAVMYERGKRYIQAAKLYQQQSRFKLAGELFTKAGHELQAGEAFEAGGDFLAAAKQYEKARFFPQAAAAYMKGREFKRAGRLYEAALREERVSAKDDPKRMRAANELGVKAAECFQKLDDHDRAVGILSEIGFYERAATIRVHEKNFEDAADLYVKANLPLQAAEMYRQMGDLERAARIQAEVLHKEGNEIAAADSYRQAGELLEAAEIYRRHERYSQAAEVYQAMGDLIQAGEMFLRAKDPRKAAEAWEQAGDFRRAAEVYQRLGDGRKQSELLEKSGEHYEAGLNYYRLKMTDNAESALKRVTPEHPAARKAAAILGDIYREQGKPALAVKKYQQAIAGQPVSKANLHPYYNLARVLEQAGDPRVALTLYQRLHKEDSQFSDVAERLATLQSRVATVEREEAEVLEPVEELAPAAATTQPRTKRRYTMLSELGRGGMGIVYKAHDSVLDRVVAFKILPSDLRNNDIAVKNFLREAKAAAGLNHPNIVIVYDAGEEDNNYYIAMEHIEGRTLREIVSQEGRLPLQALFIITAQLSKALDYAHGRNVVHRDIKGSNVMWTPDKTVKVMDFGLAKVIQEVVNFQTVVGGTPHYMAPEQILGEEIDCRADLYSLGVTLYECATASVPFPKGDVGYHHIHTPPPDPRELNPDLPEAYANILLKCLAKDPNERYQRAGEIYDDLKEVRVGR